MSKIVLAIIETERFPQEVAKRAAWIAKRNGCDLALVLSDPTLGFLRDSFMISADSKQIAETIKQAQAEELEQLAASVEAAGLKVTTSIFTDRPASDAIVAKALDCEPAFVVKGAVARTGLKRRILGSTAEQVLDHLHCDILIARVD